MKRARPLLRLAGTRSSLYVADLQRANVLSLPALWSFGDLELNALALLQAAEAARLDGREMHKYIFASLSADKAVALGVVKPLYCSLFCHFVACILFRLFTLVRVGGTEGRTSWYARSCSTTDFVLTQLQYSR